MGDQLRARRVARRSLRAHPLHLARANVVAKSFRQREGGKLGGFFLLGR
jgi:hypothetical protein